jgi:hypothetical protein
VKVSYEEALQPPDSGFKGSATRFFRRIAESLGFAAFRVGFPVPGVLDAASYHVEVIAPEDVIIAKASLVITTEDDAEHEAAVEYRQERAHLFVSHERARWQSWDLDSATKSEVDVRFSLKPGGLVVPAVLTSALTTGLLWVGLYLHRDHIAPRPEAATAVLVVLPALYAAYLAPGRDPLVRLMSVALRFLVFCSSLIAFAAASVLAIQMKPATVAHLWSWFAGVSTGITSVFAVSLLAAWIRQKGPEWRRS